MSRFHKIAYTFFPFYSLRLEQLNSNALLGRWIKDNAATPKFATRNDLYEYVHKTYASDVINYLEFGVFEGESIRKWVEMNKALESRFVGFDSFEGLPEAWGKALDAGAFDVKGAIPVIDDGRVSFVKGWFQDSLPGFLSDFDNARRLVINIDADLHSSALYCLTMLDRYIVPGTIIIYDEFVSSLHEFRAHNEYCRAFRREMKAIAMTDDFATQAAFEVIR
jgi:O-methyltransferase